MQFLLVNFALGSEHVHIKTMKILFISFRLSDDSFHFFLLSTWILCAPLSSQLRVYLTHAVWRTKLFVKTCFIHFHIIVFSSSICNFVFLFLWEISSFTIRAFKLNWRILFDYYKTRYLIVFPLSLFAWFNSQTWHPFAQREKKSRWQTFEKRKKFRDPFSLSFSFFFAVWTSELELNNIFSDLIFIRRDSWQWIKICCKVLGVRGRERGEKRNWIFFLYAFVSPSEAFFSLTRLASLIITAITRRINVHESTLVTALRSTYVTRARYTRSLSHPSIEESWKSYTITGRQAERSEAGKKEEKHMINTEKMFYDLWNVKVLIKMFFTSSFGCHIESIRQLSLSPRVSPSRGRLLKHPLCQCHHRNMKNRKFILFNTFLSVFESLDWLLPTPQNIHSNLSFMTF